MAKKTQKKKKLKKKWLHKYRLVVLNEETFEERLSLKLTRLNVFVLTGFSIILLILLTTVVIAFTPLREYIPGYSSPNLRERAINLTHRADSLAKKIKEQEQLFASIQGVLTGNLPESGIDTIQGEATTNMSEVDLAPSKADSLLRKQVEQEDKYNLFEMAMSQTDFALSPPVTGYISQAFSIEDKHYAVDIVTEKNTPVKATADGTVIFSGWTAETGYVIILEHSYGLISAYKHNASLTKQQGGMVKAGEVIATVGSTGELTTGPHLHFELWSDGYPVNPTDFISFE
jgi:murein DD-endopeptidase MepM/ murein hydrolase activator NlpD